MVNKMEETFKPVLGYEGIYEFSNLNNLRSVNRKMETVNKHGTTIEYTFKGKDITPTETQDGYTCFRVSVLSRLENLYLSRLVWEYNTGKHVPEGYQIGYIDHNNHNNEFSNLRLLTHRESCNLPDKEGLTPAQKRWKNKSWVDHLDKMHKNNGVSVARVDENGEILKKFSSIKEASVYYDIDRTAISSCCRHKQNTTHGMIFKYLREE